MTFVRFSLGVLLGCLATGRARAQPAVDPASASVDAAPVNVVVRSVSRRPSAGELGVVSSEARRGAGTQGDAAKVVQSLPGVTRLGPDEGEVSLWGALPEESRLYVDGVEVPRLFHLGGVRSVVPSDRLAGVRVVPGGYGASRGRALGGILELETRPLEVDDSHAVAAADTLDASGSGSVAFGTGAAGLSARYGYADRWLPGVLGDEAAELYVVPRYYDAQFELHQLLREGESLRLVGLTAHDSASWSRKSADPNASVVEERRAAFHRLYALYERRGGDGSRAQVTPIVGWDASALDGDYGSVAARTSDRGLRYGLRVTHESFIADDVQLSLGLDGWGLAPRVARAGSPMIPAREGDPYIFGRAPGDSYAVDEFRVHELEVGTYAELAMDIGAWRLRPGLRVEAMLIETSRGHPPVGNLPPQGTSAANGLLEPRLGLTWRASRTVSIDASWGRYHQAPAPLDLGAIHGNPNLGPQRAIHYVLSERVTLRSWLILECAGYFERLTELVVRSTDPLPAASELLVNAGEGRSYGAQAMLRHRARHGFFGWLSASLSRSERRNTSRQAWRLADHDRPVSLALVVGKELGSYTVSTRTRLASGARRTTVIGRYYDLGADGYQPLLGPANSERLATFFQLDLRVDRTLVVSDAIRAQAYVDLLNVTFRKNAEELAYSRDYLRMGQISGLPPMAIIGIQVEQ